MTKTNLGLVEYAKAQLGKPYWYGTFGNTATESLLDSKKKQYPSHYRQKRIPKYRSQFGNRVHDCVGLVKGYLWSDTPTANPKYNASLDVSANGMYSACKEKGNIAALPEIPGVLVFMPHHVGIYIGSGKVIEARGFDYGVVKTELKSRGWQSWGKCPWISYVAESLNEYFPKCSAEAVSIVDAFKALGERSDFSFRKEVALANGISDYCGSPKENIRLLSLLRRGILIRP